MKITPVCTTERLLPERGVAVLVGDLQIAVFKTYDGSLFALENFDPFSGSYVLSRGIVGSKGAIPTVASPMHKQVFDLRTGESLSDPRVRIATYPIHDADGVVLVEVP